MREQETQQTDKQYGGYDYSYYAQVVVNFLFIHSRLSHRLPLQFV